MQSREAKKGKEEGEGESCRAKRGEGRGVGRQVRAKSKHYSLPALL